MKRLSSILASAITLVVVSGCTTSNVVGTWTGRGGAAEAPFTFGSVSFVGDQTFTAEARYGGNTRVQSGTWSTAKDSLMLMSGGVKRDYTYSVTGNTLVVTEPKSGHSVTLDRMPR